MILCGGSTMDRVSCQSRPSRGKTKNHIFLFGVMTRECHDYQCVDEGRRVFIFFFFLSSFLFLWVGNNTRADVMRWGGRVVGFFFFCLAMVMRFSLAGSWWLQCERPDHQFCARFSRHEASLRLAFLSNYLLFQWEKGGGGVEVRTKGECMWLKNYSAFSSFSTPSHLCFLAFNFHAVSFYNPSRVFCFLLRKHSFSMGFSLWRTGKKRRIKKKKHSCCIFPFCLNILGEIWAFIFSLTTLSGVSKTPHFLHPE